MVLVYDNNPEGFEFNVSDLKHLSSGYFQVWGGKIQYCLECNIKNDTVIRSIQSCVMNLLSDFRQALADQCLLTCQVFCV